MADKSKDKLIADLWEKNRRLRRELTFWKFRQPTLKECVCDQLKSEIAEFPVVLINGGDFSNIDAPLEIEADSFEQLTNHVKSNFGLDQTG